MSKDIGEKTKKTKLWQFPWGYRESFLIAIFMLLGGFLLQLIIGSGVSMPGWPMNIAIIIIFILYFILIHYLVKHPVIKWLSSTYAVIASVSAFTFMVMFLGFIPQDVNPDDIRLIDSLGLSQVKSSWAYLMSALYLLLVLGFTIMRRINTFTLKNIAFLLNHIGLWLVIVSGSLGAADMWKLSMQLDSRSPAIKAYDSRGNAYDMGFGMMLLDFQIDEYPAELGVMNNEERRLIIQKGGKLATVEEGVTTGLENYTLTFERYIPFAAKYENVYDTSTMSGAARAVYVTAKDENTGQVFQGWVCDGSYNVKASYLGVGEGVSLAMTQIRAKKYSSDIRIYHSMDDYEDFHIEVNKPKKINGWKIYQTGYDELMGRWSERSYIELVRDPWLPVVYVGIFMILFGTLYLLWMGKGRTKTKKA